MTALSSAIGNRAMSRLAGGGADRIAARSIRASGAGLASGIGTRALGRFVAGDAGASRAPRQLIQRRELTALERQRVDELEREASRTDLTPAQLQALNDERNAIIEGRG